MLGAVKSHVFEEMGKPVLVVVLKQSAYILNNVKTGTLFWLFIVPDVIGHSVGEFADAHFRVNRDRLA